MEKLSILMDKYIKTAYVQKKFKSYIGVFATEDECVREADFVSELRTFLEKHPEMKDAVSID